MRHLWRWRHAKQSACQTGGASNGQIDRGNRPVAERASRTGLLSVISGASDALLIYRDQAAHSADMFSEVRPIECALGAGSSAKLIQARVSERFESARDPHTDPVEIGGHRVHHIPSQG